MRSAGRAGRRSGTAAARRCRWRPLRPRSPRPGTSSASCWPAEPNAAASCRSSRPPAPAPPGRRPRAPPRGPSSAGPRPGHSVTAGRPSRARSRRRRRPPRFPRSCGRQPRPGSRWCRAAPGPGSAGAPRRHAVTWSWTCARWTTWWSTRPATWWRGCRRGATIGQLAAAFGSAGQQLALDVRAEATVGGVVATGTAGPRRFRYGAPRDLLIGITVVRADGVGRAGRRQGGQERGRLRPGKLFAGSRGTLGVITEAAFRLHPLPAAVAWVTAEFGPAERAGAVTAVAAAAGSPLVPSAGGTGLAGRVAAAAARRGAARGHRAGGSRTVQADVRAAGGAGRCGIGRRDRTRALGCAAVVSDGGPGLVLGELAGTGGWTRWPRRARPPGSGPR